MQNRRPALKLSCEPSGRVVKLDRRAEGARADKVAFSNSYLSRPAVDEAGAGSRLIVSPVNIISSKV
jgi:hypothetical protein